MKYPTLREAVYAFVSEFNAIPQSMIYRLVEIAPDEWEEVTVFGFGHEERISFFPAWGTMWSFSDPCDIHWIEECDGVEVMSKLGFRIYYHEEYGYFFGIDGAGYDFYEQHWIPLYKARGLHMYEKE